jgi:hypothetical protein
MVHRDTWCYMWVVARYIVLHEQFMLSHVHTSRYMCLHAHTYRYPCLPVANKTLYMSLHSSTLVYTGGLFGFYIHIHANTSEYIKRYPRRVTLCMFRIHHRTSSYTRICAHLVHRDTREYLVATFTPCYMINSCVYTCIHRDICVYTSIHRDTRS